MSDVSNLSIAPSNRDFIAPTNPKAAEMQKSLDKIPAPSQDSIKQGMNFSAMLLHLNMRKSFLEAGIQPQNVPYHPASAKHPGDPTASFFDTSNYMALWLQANNAAAMTTTLSGSESAKEIGNQAETMGNELKLIQASNQQMVADQQKVQDIMQKIQATANGLSGWEKGLMYAGIAIAAVAIVAAVVVAVAGSAGLALPAFMALVGPICGILGGAATATSCTMSAVQSGKQASALESAIPYTQGAADIQQLVSQSSADLTSTKNMMQLTQTQYENWTSSLQNTLENMGNVFDAMKQMSQAV